jgi:hypothetical protein
VIFANDLLTAGATVADRMCTLNRERLGIPCGPHGEILDIDSVPRIDRERLTQIRVEIGDGLFQGVGDALAEQPPEYLVSGGGQVADAVGLGADARLDHIEQLCCCS